MVFEVFFGAFWDIEVLIHHGGTEDTEKYFCVLIFMTKKLIHSWSYEIIGCAIEVHQHLGPGLLESVYEACLQHELTMAGFEVQRQGKVPVHYKGLKLQADLRFDLLVNDTILIENKSVEVIMPIHKAQVLTYMKLLQKPKALGFNFNTANLNSQMFSLVNELYSTLPEE